jgi:hypothetical protein
MRSVFFRCLPRPQQRIVAGLGLAFLCAAHAAVPTLDHLFPPSGRPGSTNEINGVGTLTPWPVQLVFNHPGIRAEPTTNSPKFRVVIDPDVPPGTYLARALNDEGASNPRFLIVDPRPVRAESEPNDAASQAQVVGSLPALIEGRLEKRDDVDTFEVTLAKGRTLVARLEAFVLASPLDAVLRIRNEQGSLIGWNHDDGFTFDPFLAVTAPESGRYRIEVFGFPHPAESDVRFTGNARCVYRLHLHDGPYAQSLDPAGLSRTLTNEVRVLGFNLPAAMPVLQLPAQSTVPTHQAWIQPAFREVAGPAWVPMGHGPEICESREGTNAPVLPVPGAVTGTLATRGERDRYAFVATQGATYRAEVQAAALGSPLDASLRILDAAGKELAHDDDSTLGDPALTWKAPADGTFLAVVGSVLSRTGPDHRYRLQLEQVLPGIRAVAAASALTVEPGKTNEFKISVQRVGGLEGPLRVEVQDPPEGVTVGAVDMAADAKEATLVWITATNAPPAQRRLRIHVRHGTNGPVSNVLHELATTGENNGVPQGFHRLLLNETDWLWITVRKP